MKRPVAAGTVDDAPPPERTGTAVTGHGAAAGWLTTCSWEDLKPTDGSNKQALDAKLYLFWVIESIQNFDKIN